MLERLWHDVNEALQPFTTWLLSFQSAPIVVVAALVLGFFGFLSQRKQAKRQRDVEKDIQSLRQITTEQREAIERALTVAGSIETARTGADSAGERPLRRALEDYATGDDIRGLKIPLLIADRRIEEAKTLAFDIAERTESAAQRLGGKWQEKAAQAWADAGEVAYLFDPPAALMAFERASTLGLKDIRITKALAILLYRVGRIQEADTLFSEVEASLGPEEHAIRADLLGNRGLIARSRSDLAAAERLHKEALSISRSIGDRYREAQQLGNLGSVALDRHDLDRAEALITQALRIFEQLGNARAIAINTNNLCTVYQMRGDDERLRAELGRLVPLQERLGDRDGLANSYGMLGLLARSAGDLTTADAMLHRAFALHKEVENREGMARDLSNLGLLAQSRHDYNAAQTLHTQALELFKQIGDDRGRAGQIGNLALAAYRGGQLDEADRLFSESIAIFERLNDREGLAIDLINSGTVANARGDKGAACAKWGRARALMQAIGHPAVEQVTKQMREAGCPSA